MTRHLLYLSGGCLSDSGKRESHEGLYQQVLVGKVKIVTIEVTELAKLTKSQ